MALAQSGARARFRRREPSKAPQDDASADRYARMWMIEVSGPTRRYPPSPAPAHSTHRIPSSALSLNVTSAPLFFVPSGRTQVSSVAICLLQDSHCSGSCLMGAFYDPCVDAAAPRGAQCVRSAALGWEEACV